MKIKNDEKQKSTNEIQKDNFNPFKPKRAVIVSKSSLLEYEFEKLGKPFKSFDDQQLITQLGKKYSSAVDLKQRHDQQQQYIASISKELERHNIEYRVVKRRQYSDEFVDWGDLIISAGGDGTFLTAAKRVINSNKPVIGINTDPIGSEGFLCLTGKSRHPADEVIRQFLADAALPGFRWLWRQRIRVTFLNFGFENGVSPSPSSSSSIQQHENQINGVVKPSENDEHIHTAEDIAEEENADETNLENSRKTIFSSDDEDQEINTARDSNLITSRWLALNEVFIGESHAARVSYYDVQVDNGPMTKQKSSGMTICTGTGSSSWHFNINRMTEQTIEEVLSVIDKMGLKLDQVVDAEMIENICRKFNEKLRFGPELTTMAFSVRDPVFNATFPKMAIRGFANKILIKSRCKNAHLILDGSTSMPFNRGAEVLLEIHPEDALRTAVFSKEHRS
uniref:NAD(+) kinase n=1 Tax=Meloidogyne javanica TaxID=6303 RepID=A0A915LIC9_MELJA